MILCDTDHLYLISMMTNIILDRRTVMIQITST